MIIRDLTDLAQIDALVAESEAEGHRFVRRYFDRPVELVVAAFDESGALVGVCGLDTDPYVNDPSVARVRHLYVRAPARRRGVGRRLVTAIIDRARDRYARLGLRTDDPEADLFYRALGFERCADEPSSTHVMMLSPRCRR